MATQHNIACILNLISSFGIVIWLKLGRYNGLVVLWWAIGGCIRFWIRASSQYDVSTVLILVRWWHKLSLAILLPHWLLIVLIFLDFGLLQNDALSLEFLSCRRFNTQCRLLVRCHWSFKIFHYRFRVFSSFQSILEPEIDLGTADFFAATLDGLSSTS